MRYAGYIPRAKGPAERAWLTISLFQKTITFIVYPAQKQAKSEIIKAKKKYRNHTEIGTLTLEMYPVSRCTERDSKPASFVDTSA